MQCFVICNKLIFNFLISLFLEVELLFMNLLNDIIHRQHYVEQGNARTDN